MKDFMPGVKIEYHPNENCIGLHLRYKMVDNKVFVSSDLSDSIKIKALPNLPKVIFNLILDINVVKSISKDRVYSKHSKKLYDTINSDFCLP